MDTNVSFLSHLHDKIINKIFKIQRENYYTSKFDILFIINITSIYIIIKVKVYPKLRLVFFFGQVLIG
jgi:hypothetical protein